MRTVVYLALLDLLSWSHALPHSGGRCDIAQENLSDCGYYDIKENECIQRGCCWRPCDDCGDVPWCYKSRDASGVDGDIRLADVDSEGRGRLEVFYHGNWGRVCDDNFNNKAAIVACRQLGYPVSDSDVFDYFHLYPETEGLILLDKVSCAGNEERLVDCDHNPFNFHECGNYEDVFLSCEPIEGKIRLSDGDRGRLEILYRGEWGAAYQFSASVETPTVICQSLGFDSGSQIENDDNEEEMPSLLTTIDCTGSEDNVLQCDHSPFYISTKHTSDAHLYISCEEEDSDETEQDMNEIMAGEGSTESE